MNEFTVVDLETTGLNAARDRIIEIGALKIRNGIVEDQFLEFVNPERAIPERITEVTGIDDEMVQTARTIREVLPDFLKFAGTDVLMGHNLMFDYSFLKQNALNLSLKFERMGVDTLKISRSLLKELPSRRLEDLCRYFAIEDNNHHRALNDASVTWQLYQVLREKFFPEQPELFAPVQMCYAAKKQSPATARQISFLLSLAKRCRVELQVSPESMTKSEASRMIDQLMSQK